MLGYCSVEWTFLSVTGLAAAAWLRVSAARLPGLDYGWRAALLLTLSFFVLLRVAGRTPEGIIYGSHPAAQGHPRLSLAVTAAVFAILASRLIGQ